MKLRCSCGARIEFPVGSSLKESDAQALNFWEKHSECREGILAQSKALQDIATTLHDIFVLIERHETK